MSAQLWHAEAGLMRLQTPRISATVDLARPAVGLHAIEINGTPLGDQQLLGVEITPSLGNHRPDSIEHFLRGGDLAVVYPDQPQREARTQIYWRAATNSSTIASLELLVSVQTNLLNSRPQLAARSMIAAESAWRLDDFGRGTFVEITGKDEDANLASGGCLFRLNSELSYAQLVHPADSQATCCQVRRVEAPRYELRHQLFAEHLEKGVILRARVLGVLLERANDMAAAAQHFADFLAADLPLTT